MSVTTAPAAPAAPRRRVLQGALSGSGATWLLVPPIVFLLLLLGLPILFGGRHGYGRTEARGGRA
jgi:hypothetical protein